MSDVEQSPEFQEARQKACEAEYNAYVFGDRRKAKAAEKLSPSVAKVLKDVERVKKQAEEQRRRAETMMASAKSRMPAMPMMGMFPTPVMPTLPEVPTQEDIEKYREQVDTYSQTLRNQAQLMQDPSIQRGMERFSLPSQGLICPECGDVDHGNRMDKTPWCIKCNCALESPNKKHGKKQPRIKRAEKKVPNILRGLPEEKTKQ